MAEPDEGGLFVSVPSRRYAYNQPPLLSPRISFRTPPRPPDTPTLGRIASDRHGEQSKETKPGEYVERVYEGSLVHYYPDEVKVSKMERRFIFSGALSSFLGMQDFVTPEVWRAALSEFLATGLLIFVSSAGAITCLQGGFTSATAATAIVEFFALSFLILAAAPASGGHLNPAITIATMLTGFSSPARSFLYVIAQSAGSVLGALALKVVVATDVAEEYGLGGCFLRNTVLSNGELVEAGIATGPGLLSEFIFTLTLLYFAFSVALDPKQFQVTGPILAPFMIGAIIGMLIYASGGLMDVSGGYTGAGLNPARCFGPAVAMGGDQWTDHWVFWVGPLLACLTISIIYHVVPPHHVELYRTRKDFFTHLRELIRNHVSGSSSSIDGATAPLIERSSQ